MRKITKGEAIIRAIIFIIAIMVIGEISKNQFNKYEDMSIQEVMEKKYGEEKLYIKAEDYYFVLYEGIDYDIFYIDEDGKNILINTSASLRKGKMKLSFIPLSYTVFDTTIKNNEDFVFKLHYAGDRENVIVYDNDGEWDSIIKGEDIYFFNAIKFMQSDYVAYIDYGDGKTEEIKGEYIINEFNK